MGGLVWNFGRWCKSGKMWFEPANQLEIMWEKWQVGHDFHNIFVMIGFLLNLLVKLLFCLQLSVSNNLPIKIYCKNTMKITLLRLGTIYLGSTWEEVIKWNGMKIIFLEYSSLSLVWESKRREWKIHSLIWEFKWERMKWVRRNTHSSLFSKKLKFLFPRT